jgi:hypothetical protein
MESVMIQKARNHHIMNNKAEYNRCALPRLTAKLGEKDLERWRESDRMSRQDTTLAVPVPSLTEMAKSIVEKLKARWTRTKPGVEESLDRVEGWADAELRIQMLGWLATRTDIPDLGRGCGDGECPGGSCLHQQHHQDGGGQHD